MKLSAREAWQGFGAGAVAGVVFAIAMIVLATSNGDSAVLPFRMFASLWFGDIAFREHAGGPPRVDDLVIIGAIVHLTLSIVAGFLYAVIDAQLSARYPLEIEHRATLGFFFGIVLWLIDFQLLGRLFYPWFLELPQAPHAILHALTFGLPLGLVYGLLAARRHPAEPMVPAR